MRHKKIMIVSGLLFLLITGLISFKINTKSIYDEILAYIVDSKTQDLQLFWKNDKGEILKSIQELKSYVERKNKKLVFAMNGGMYMANNNPLGLYIQEQHLYAPLNTRSGKGNFYTKPNGVFYITTDNLVRICKTGDFVKNDKIKYATQSGPMLVIDGQIHSAFKLGSTSLYIRNGVGILPDNRIVFAMSKKEINFYDFAKYFQNLGCKNALYLDGFVSRTYLPEKNWAQTDGDFGVMFGVIKK